MPRIMLASLLSLAVAARGAPCQDAGAAALANELAGLGVSARVLMIGAHPDDEDTQLLAFLARGRHVETAYLSLTRGDGGQNRIGNELGEALGVIRTEELLAARRIDGANQYFARAYDFGFSKTADETFRHWPRDEILRDVTSVVRSFRPHIIVAVFSGTPRDGHGHHQVAGILAREAFEAAADSVKYPPAASFGLPAWSTLKLYQTQRGNTVGATVAYNVGEFSPVLGRSFAEIAGASRSQHKSQGFGSLEPIGPRMVGVRLERSLLGAVAVSEQSIFDGIDTTYNRLRHLAAANGALDSVLAAITAARATYRVYEPATLVQPLARAAVALERLCDRSNASPDSCSASRSESPDLASSKGELSSRIGRALSLALGLAFQATSQSEVVAAGDATSVSVAIHNRGAVPFRIASPAVAFGGAVGTSLDTSSVLLRPDSAFRITLSARPASDNRGQWWLATPRASDMFAVQLAGNTVSPFMPPGAAAENRRPPPGIATATVLVNGARIPIFAPVVHRYADPVEGETAHAVAVAPLISVTLDREVEFAVAGAQYDRTVTVTLRSAAAQERSVSVSLLSPQAISIDSALRTMSLPAGGTRTASFRLRGTLPSGTHRISAVASVGQENFVDGYTLVDYPHIAAQRMYRPALLTVRAVDLVIPATMNVAYIPGVGDNLVPVLRQMGVPITVLPASEVATTELSRYSAVVVGPRAYDANPDLAAANVKLFTFVRNGGTMLVQFGQNMNRPGIMPFPVGAAGNQERVTEEDAPVRILDPGSPLLNTPNKISAADFSGWVQERATYMPGSRDAAYKPLLAMNDTGEEPLDGGLLVAQMGTGTYVYCGLALFRQIPTGVPGAARLMVNLMAGGR
jgi:LmbE family N-acetylglucosaminyl deacetylase